MKKSLITALLLAGLCSSLKAQPPVTTNLKLRLEAALGYNTQIGNDIWLDLSGSNNHVIALNGTTAEPLWGPNFGGPGVPGVLFDGNSDVMTKAASVTNGFTNTNATLFIVRIANTAYTTLPGPFPSQWNVMLAIGENNTYNNDFSLMSDWVVHSSTGGNWVNRSHPCYSTLPDCRPAVVAGRLLTGIGDGQLDYYVNGNQSTNTPVIQGSPAAFTGAKRGIAVGATWDASSGFIAPATYFQGAILEILGYDRALTDAEIAKVNDYLMKKYHILKACETPRCDPDFSWTVSTTNNNTYTFNAQNLDLPYNYEWVINGPGGSLLTTVAGPSMTYTFPMTAPSSYTISLRMVDCDGNLVCQHKINFCHGDKGPNTVGFGNCNTHFSISSNTNTPNQVTLTAASATGPYTWDVTGPGGTTTYTGNPVTLPVTPGSGIYNFKLTIGTAGSNCYRSSVAHCFYNNQPSPYKLAAVSSASDIALSIVPNPASALVNLQLSQPAGEMLLLRITDMSGKTVYAAEAAAGTDKIQVALDQFAAGMYLVQLRGRNLQLNGKFVKQ